MKRFFLLLCFILSFADSTFSQESTKSNYDSLWYFHPFSINLSLGLWTPFGRLSEYCKPSFQLGLGYGMRVRRTGIQLFVTPRLIRQNKLIPIRIGEKLVEGKTVLGGNIGGCLTYTFYQNRIISTEFITSATWEFISTKVLKYNYVDTLDVNGVGISLGVNTWINTFYKLNFGLRAIYTYTTYDNSSNLYSSIGGHSMTFSLLYRFTQRNDRYKSWYEE